MKLLSVELENFRNHENSLYEFDRGVNLILGKNGSGKSSIIEAIGLALFGGGLRDRQEDAVMWERNRARVVVTFLADDGNQYRAEKVFGSTSNHELRQGELLVARGRDSVIEKVKTICNLQGDIAKTFENVIVAFQNRIAEQFLGSPAPRREYFNRVFQVDLYRRIATDYMKEYLSGLKSEIALMDGEISLTGKVVEKKSELEKRQEAKLAELANDLKKLEEVESKLTGKKTELETLRSKEREINSLGEKLSILLKDLVEEARRLKESHRQLNTSLRAREITARCFKGHEKYNELLAREKELDGRKNELEAISRKVVEIGRKLAKKTTEQARLQERTAATERRKGEISESLKTLRERRMEQYGDLEEKRRLLRERELFLQAWNDRKSAAKVLREEYEKAGRGRIELEAMIKRQSDGLTAQPDPQERLEALDAQEKSLQENIARLESLLAAKAGVSARLKALEESIASLSRGLCPLLNESCKNILERENYAESLERMVQELEDRADKIDRGIEELEGSRQSLEELKKDRARLERDCELKAQAAGELQALREKLERSLERLEKSRRQIETVLKGSGTPEEMFEALEDGTREAITAVEKARSEVRLSEKGLADIDGELENKLALEVESDRELKKLASAGGELVLELQEMQRESDGFESLLCVLPDLTLALEETRREMNSHKSDYDQYNRNSVLAGYLEEYTGNFRQSLELCREKSKRIGLSRHEFGELRRGFDRSKLKEVAEEFEGIQEAQRSGRDEVTSIKKDLDYIETELDRIREHEKRLKELKERKALIERKVSLAEKMRENLNLTGEKITAGFRDSIEKKATADYRKISGIEESIIWNEDYEVFLKSPGEAGASLRSFSNLSGGEQVLVSLCLRAAMTNVLSGARLAIFDEPTSNLDRERKELLAQSMRELFGELDQAIIVTHDDVFSEMAQKVIRLGD
ncbi:MAG: AAA family ATPase [Mesotoga sp.]